MSGWGFKSPDWKKLSASAQAYQQSLQDQARQRLSRATSEGDIQAYATLSTSRKLFALRCPCVFYTPVLTCRVELKVGHLLGNML